MSTVARLADDQLPKEPLHAMARSVIPNKPESDTDASSTRTGIERLRDDLGIAQRSRGQLQARFNSIERELESQVGNLEAERMRTADLTKSLQYATTKLRDKDEELRGKAKLLEVSELVNPRNKI